MILLEDIVISKHISVDKNVSLEVAISEMYKNSNGVVVITHDNRAVGIITQKDILNILTKSIDLNIKVKDLFLNENLISVNIKRSIEYVLNVIIDNNIKRIIVVDDNDNYIGIVSQESLVKSLEEDSFRINLLISNFINNNNKLITLEETDTIDNAFTTMVKYHIGSVIIVNSHNIAIGILTQKDAINIANSKLQSNILIKDVMSTPVITVKEHSIAKDVIDLMVNKHINQVLVIQDKTNLPLSTISMRDIAHNLKGNYGHILESKLRNIKKTLNYIGELVLEIYDDNGEQIIQWMNKGAIEQFGKCTDKHLYSIIDKDVWNKIYSQIKRQTNCEKLKVNINDMYFELTCSYHFVNKKETILLILRDITKFECAIINAEQKSKELTKELSIVQSVIDQQNNIVFVTDGHSIISTNKSFYKFFEINSIEEFENKFKCITNLFIQHQDFFFLKQKDNWTEVISKLHEKDRIVSMIEASTIDPKVFTVQLNKLNSDPNNYVITFTDITEIKLESQKYYFNATHDALTKIYNRAYYLDAIKIALDKVKRYKSTFSIILFDIDNFKKFNDTYGHIKGDEILIHIAQVINKNVRTSDVFARWGGEEFIVLLPETFLEKAELLAKNLQQIIENIKIEGISQVTASFGVTQFNEFDNENTITKRADEAMYKAKNNGKNQVVTA